MEKSNSGQNISERFLQSVGADFITEIDRIFNFEMIRLLRSNADAETSLRTDADWLKKKLPDCIDKTLEKYLSLLSDSKIN